VNDLDRLLQLSGQQRCSATVAFAQQRTVQIADYLVSMSEDLDRNSKVKLVEYIKEKLNAY